MRNILILFLISIFIISCNTDIKDNKEGTIIKKVPSQTKNNTKKFAQVEGTWYGTGMTKIVVVSKLSSTSFEFHSYYKDGSDKKETATLNSSNEYHTYNRFNEYYKLVNGKLGVYDNQGLIEFYNGKRRHTEIGKMPPNQKYNQKKLAS